MRWAAPVWLNLIWISLGILILLIKSYRQRKNTTIDFELWKRLTKNFDTHKSYTCIVLIMVSLFFLILALARPQYGLKSELIQTRGLEIILAVDVSKSMLAQDLAPNRLKRVQAELNYLIQKLSGHKIGLVAFAGAAAPICPLTLDESAVYLYVEALHTDMLSAKGTAVVSALKNAENMFSKSSLFDRIIILFTDGGEEEEEATEQAQQLEKNGIKVYAIGVGSEEGEPIPVFDKEGHLKGHKKDKEGHVVLSKLNLKLLKDIARITHGEYATLSASGREIDYLVQSLQDLAFQKFEEKILSRYEDRFQWPLGCGIILLLWGWLLGSRKNFWKIWLQNRTSFSRKANILLMTLGWLCCFSQLAWLDSSYDQNQNGIKDYKNKNYDKAHTAFTQAQKKSKDLTPTFNAGLALRRLEKDQDSQKLLEEATLATNKKVRSQAYYTLGNSSFNGQQWNDAIEFYKKALLQDPNYSEAKYNLELAQHYQKQNESQSDQDQDKDKDQKSQDSQSEQNQKSQSQEQDSSTSSRPEDDKDQNSDSKSQEQNPPESDHPDQQNSKTEPKSKPNNPPKENQSQSEQSPAKKDQAQSDLSKAEQKNAGKGQSKENAPDKAQQAGMQEINNILDALDSEEKNLQWSIYQKQSDSDSEDSVNDW